MQGTSCNLKCCSAIVSPAAKLSLPEKVRMMSQQLTLSSLFCVLALAGLCVVTSARDLAGVHPPVVAERAELPPGPLAG